MDGPYPRLVAQGQGGAIVITSSMARVVPLMRTEHAKTLGMLGYGAAKAGVIQLMRNCASFLASRSIRVNAIAPTGVDTPMLDNEMLQEH